MKRVPLWIYVFLFIMAIGLFITAIYMIVNEPQETTLIIEFIIISLISSVYLGRHLHNLVKIYNQEKQYSNSLLNFLKITGSELIDYIEISDDFIVINYCKKNSMEKRKILKNDISKIEIDTCLAQRNNTTAFIYLKNEDIIHFNMDTMSLYDFIKQMKLICNVKHNIEADKLFSYKKEILEKDIEHYIVHGKKMSANSKIKLSINKFYYYLILAFILYFGYLFLSTFIH